MHCYRGYRARPVFALAVVAGLSTLAGSSATAQIPSIGPNGANALGLGLNGAGVLVGQVEPGRPGLPALDNAQNRNNSVTPAGVFEVNYGGVANRGTAPHAEQVAGIMISQHAGNGGISPNALLYSSSINGNNANAQVDGMVSLQTVLNAGQVRAVNMSFGYLPAGGAAVVNGQDFFTLGTDWSARQKDYLPVVAGDETGPALGLSVPIDNYNGITVGMLRADGAGVFRIMDNGNVFTTQTNNRRLIGLVAPGVGIISSTFGNRFTSDTFTDANANGGWDRSFFNNNGIAGFQTSDNWLENFSGTGAYNNVFNAADDWYFDRNFNNVRDGAANDDYYIAPGDPRFAPPTSEAVQDVDGNGIIDFRINGTSFAAPHVSGAVALLHQYAAVAPPAAHDHNVMKAVLLNSVDKRRDTGDGMLLGMQKTILRTDGNDWVQQYNAEGAAARVFDPTDTQLGTGALNVRRAVMQLGSGKHLPGPVPLAGWNSDFVNNGAFQEDRYEISQALVANSWISITLTWDRVVNLTNNFGAADQFDAETFLDLNNNGVFDAGDQLTDLNANGNYDQGNTDAFANVGFNDLDLYLVKHGDPIALQIAESISARYNLEHIFVQIPADGLYDFVVRFNSGVGGMNGQTYAVAWWSVPEPSMLAVVSLSGLAAISRPRRKK